MVFTGPVLYFTFTSNEITKLFLHLFFFYFSWTTLEIYFDNFFEVTHEKEKNITGPHDSVHFENGPNAKNGYKIKKCLRKREKDTTGPHASVPFENGPNAKNA